MIFMNSSSSRIIAIVSLLTLTSQLSSAAPTNRLTRDLAQECSAALQSDPVFVEVLQKTAALVVRNHRVPTNVELATALRTTEPLFLELLKKVGIPNVTELVRIAFQQFRSEAERSREHMLKLAGKFVGQRGRIPDRKHLSAITNTPRDQLEVVYGSLDNLSEVLTSRRPEDMTKVRNRIIKTFIKLARQFGRVPTEDELAQALNNDEGQLAEFFGKHRVFRNYEELVAVAFANGAGRLRNVINTELFSEERAHRMLDSIRNHKRLIVTTAVAGHRVNQELLDSMLRYCEENDAEIIVIPANLQTTGLQDVLLNHPKIHILTNTIQLSGNLALNNIKILAKAPKPLTGLEYIGPVNQTQIIGSPKIHLRAIPTVDNAINSKLLLTTGAITHPDYQGQLYVQGRTDSMASSSRVHIFGGLIIEKTNGTHLFPAVPNPTGEFHLRHFEFVPEKNGFRDLDRFYTAQQSSPVKPRAVVLGDLHIGFSTSQPALDALRRQILSLDPDLLVVHDILDGYSISHHDEKDLIRMARKAEAGELNLKDELEGLIVFLNSLLAANPRMNIAIVHSNHNHWIKQYLKEGRYVRDFHNARIGTLLASVTQNGADPLETVIRFGLSHFRQDTREGQFIINPVSDPNRITFIHAGESLKVGSSSPTGRQVELGLHGHAGAAGMRGSLESLARGTPAVVFGHTHTIGIFNRAFNIGTFTHTVLDYSRDGISNWVQGLAIVGQEGDVQLLQYKDGEWFTPRGEPNLPANDFFEDGYPLLVPNNEGGTGEGDIDQYSQQAPGSRRMGA